MFYVIDGKTCDPRKSESVARYSWKDDHRGDVDVEVYRTPGGELFEVESWQARDDDGDWFTKTTAEMTDWEEIEKLMAQGTTVEVMHDGVFTLPEERE